jgi:hypothetical protein
MSHTAFPRLDRRWLLAPSALLVLSLGIGTVALTVGPGGDKDETATGDLPVEGDTSLVQQVRRAGLVAPAAADLNRSFSGDRWSVQLSESFEPSHGFAVVHWDQDAPTITWVDTDLGAVTAIIAVSGASPGVAVRASAGELLVSDTEGEGRLLVFDMANGLALKASIDLPGQINSITGLSPLQLSGDEKTLLYTRRAAPPVEPNCSVTSISGGTFPCDSYVLVAVSFESETPYISGSLVVESGCRPAVFPSGDSDFAVRCVDGSVLMVNADLDILSRVSLAAAAEAGSLHPQSNSLPFHAPLTYAGLTANGDLLGLFRDGWGVELASDGSIAREFRALPDRMWIQRRPVALDGDSYAIAFGSNWQSLLVDGIAFVNLGTGVMEQAITVAPADTISALGDGTVIVVRDGLVSTVAPGASEETPLTSVEDDEDVVIVAPQPQ